MIQNKSDKVPSPQALQTKTQSTMMNTNRPYLVLGLWDENQNTGKLVVVYLLLIQTPLLCLPSFPDQQFSVSPLIYIIFLFFIHCLLQYIFYQKTQKSCSVNIIIPSSERKHVHSMRKTLGINACLSVCTLPWRFEEIHICNLKFSSSNIQNMKLNSFLVTEDIIHLKI